MVRGSLVLEEKTHSHPKTTAWKGFLISESRFRGSVPSFSLHEGKGLAVRSPVELGIFVGSQQGIV